jgi:hypothetical protein
MYIGRAPVMTWSAGGPIPHGLIAAVQNWRLRALDSIQSDDLANPCSSITPSLTDPLLTTVRGGPMMHAALPALPTKNP